MCLPAYAPIDPEPGAEDGPPAVGVEPPVDDGGMCENVDEAQCAISLCTVGCIAAAGLGCAAVAALCFGGDAIAVGTMTIPCVLAVVAACGFTGGSALENCAGVCS